MKGETDFAPAKLGVEMEVGSALVAIKSPHEDSPCESCFPPFTVRAIEGSFPALISV